MVVQDITDMKGIYASFTGLKSDVVDRDIRISEDGNTAIIDVTNEVANQLKVND